MGPPPTVTGLSPIEGVPGTKITIRGEDLGTWSEDLIGKLVCFVATVRVVYLNCMGWDRQLFN